MRYKVLLTEGAEHDLEEIYNYIAGHDSPISANSVLDGLIQIVEGLTSFPERGSHPNELMDLGIREYRQSFFKLYRVIYRVIGEQVIIYLIADSRRDMQSLLSRRLLNT